MSVRILTGDCRSVLATLPDESVHCVVTSPPYFGLRDYGVAGQIGLEPTPDEFVDEIVAVFRDVRRILRSDGVCWINLGDSYANDGKWGGYTGGKHVKALHCSPIGRNKRYTGLKPKDLIGVPWMVAFALRSDGWYLRQDIIWSKPNPMPESVRDRCTKAHEYLFLLSKSERYYYDADAIREPISASTVERWGKDGTARKSPGSAPERNDTDAAYQGETTCGFSTEGRNKRSVWEVATQPFSAVRLARAVGGGSGRKVSSGCPLHGDQSKLASTDQCGERQAASPSVGSRGTDSGPALELSLERAPIEMRRVEHCVPDNLDLLDLQCSAPAIAHNSEIHRTGRAPETLQHVSGGEASPRHIGGNGPPLETPATSDRIPESKSGGGCAQDGTPPYRAAQTESDIVGMCTCQEDSTLTDHFAVFPPALIEPCIKAGCPIGGTVLDPFGGAGTTGLVADNLQRNAILIELNPDYAAMAEARIARGGDMFADVSREDMPPQLSWNEMWSAPFDFSKEPTAG